jgi:MerR HTH family regulatory protein
VGSNVTIGDFSRATHLSVKTLRHYHEVGLLVPTEIDPHTGYRYYTEEQIPTAGLIRRLRALQTPVGDVESCAIRSERVYAVSRGCAARTRGAISQLTVMSGNATARQNAASPP